MKRASAQRKILLVPLADLEVVQGVLLFENLGGLGQQAYNKAL